MTTANVFFGRFQPFTKAHEKAIDYIDTVSGNTFIFSSHTRDQKFNPLSFGQKIEIFDDMANNNKWENAHFLNLSKETVNSPADAIRFLGHAGWEKINLFAGDDRMEKYRDFLKYVGTKGKAPQWPNIKEMTLISTGDRDPETESLEGISASKARYYAQHGNFHAFCTMAPDGLTLRQLNRLYNLVRTGLGIDTDDVRNHL